MRHREFYEFLDFSRCKTKDDIVKEIKRCSKYDTDIYLADNEGDAKEWLLQPFVDDGEDTDEIEIYHKDCVYEQTITVCDEEGAGRQFCLSIKAYYIDPGSVEYAYEYFLSEKADSSSYNSPY